MRTIEHDCGCDLCQLRKLYCDIPRYSGDDMWFSNIQQTISTI